MTPHDHFDPTRVLPGAGDAPAPVAGLSRERLPDCTLIALHGDLDLATTPQLRERLHAALLDPGPLVVIDLSGVAFCDASGLAVLVGARGRTEPRGVAVVLAAPRPQLEKLLRISGLDRAFTVRRSVAAARLTGGSAAA